MMTSTEDRLRCENIGGSVFYSSIKPYLSRGGSTYGPNRHRPPPPFDRLIMQIQPILGYFWAIFGLYQPPGPPFWISASPFYISWIRPCLS